MSSVKYAILTIVLFAEAAKISCVDPCIVNKFEDVSDTVKNCENIILDSLSIPGGQQLAINLNEGSTLTFRGNTSFGYYEWEGHLLTISGTNIVVKGETGSVLDGQGPLYWDGQGGWGNTTKPSFVKLRVTNAIFSDIHVKNCPLKCIKITSSENVTVRNFKIDNLDGDEGVAPANKFGHNTDGFGISSSQDILIEDSSVYNQDDCVAIISGKGYTIRNLFCHGSHGISLSVAGKIVEDILVENSILTMGENGIHIKTHVNAGEGLIKNVLYRNITLLDSKYYGINIQQNYRSLPAGEPQDGPPKNNVPIHNLTVENIWGNVLNGAVPVYVLCAEVGCFDWKWKGINIYGAVADNCTNYMPDGYNC